VAVGFSIFMFSWEEATSGSVCPRWPGETRASNSRADERRSARLTEPGLGAQVRTGMAQARRRTSWTVARANSAARKIKIAAAMTWKIQKRLAG